MRMTGILLLWLNAAALVWDVRAACGANDPGRVVSVVVWCVWSSAALVYMARVLS